jgi:hypothetical protein
MQACDTAGAGSHVPSCFDTSNSAAPPACLEKQRPQKLASLLESVKFLSPVSKRKSTLNTAIEISTQSPTNTINSNQHNKISTQSPTNTTN